MIRSHNLTVGFSERYSSRSYYGFDDWKRICFKTDVIKKPGINSDPYLLFIYIFPSVENSEAYIDDISIERSSFIIGLNNERDEVYDNVNVVYRIYANKELYNLSDFELKTRIKDEDITIFEKNIKISSFSFTDSINIKKVNLKENNFYQVESILNNKKDNITDISSYPFKKIKNKIKRNVSYDEYGRIFLNEELFLPLIICSYYYKDEYLKFINQTHFNVILAPYDNDIMDKIYSTYQGKIKVIYYLNFSSFYDPNPNTIKQKEENYKKNIVDIVNKLKDNPTLFGWFINDEQFAFHHKDIRNITLTIHELDPNHPTFSVIMGYGEMPLLLIQVIYWD